MSWTAQFDAKVLTHSTSKRERMFRVRPDNCSLKKLGFWLMDPSNRRRRNQNEPQSSRKTFQRTLFWWCGWVSLSCRKRPALFLRVLFPMKVLSWMKGLDTAWKGGPMRQEHLLPPTPLHTCHDPCPGFEGGRIFCSPGLGRQGSTPPCEPQGYSI